jgi:site-specific recombinase XerD
MAKSSKTIAEHVPYFLDYCAERGLSENTKINYQRYLSKFILWLKINNKIALPPNELTLEYIASYSSYLADIAKNGHALHIKTQFYHLVAIRALLGYFEAINEDSIRSSEIKLPKAFIGQENIDIPGHDQLNKILDLPMLDNCIGIRDRLILELLISYGMKPSQLVGMDRTYIKGINNLSLSVAALFERYFEFRKDSEKALFINFSKNNKFDRLTMRSVERLVKIYKNKAGIVDKINPRGLRNAYTAGLWEKEITIEGICSHKELVHDNYNDYYAKNSGIKPTGMRQSRAKWNEVESAVQKEIKWLKNNISVIYQAYRKENTLIKCDDCILRKLAILIVSGKIVATIVTGSQASLWSASPLKNVARINRHGSDWHREMMDKVGDFLKNNGSKVMIEPAINFGRADLGFLKNGNDMFIEIGTVSLFKLWHNLSTMDNIKIVVVPEENKLIEFSN